MPRRVLRRFLISNDDPITFVLLSFVVLSAVWSLDRANWVPGLHSLSLVAVVALFTGTLAARIRWPGVVLHLLAAVLGSGMILLLASLVLPATGWDSRLSALVAELGEWGQAFVTRGVSDGVIVFAVALLVLTWLVSYLSAWLVFRGRRVWWAIIPSALIVLVNLSNLPSRFYVHLLPFLIASLLLLAHGTLVQRERRLRKSRADHPRLSRLSFMGYSLWFVILAVIGAWSLPVFERPAPVGNVLTSISGQWERVQVQSFHLFESIASKEPPAEPLYVAPDQPALYFGGPVNLSDQVIFTVRSDAPRRWRIRNYDVYTPQGWLSSQTVQLPIDESGASLKAEPLLRRTEVTHTLKLQVFSPFFFSAGEPLAVDLPAVAEVRSEGASTSITAQPSSPPSSEPSVDGGEDARGYLVAGQAQDYASPERPGPDDVVLLGPELKWVLRPFQEYTIVSSLSEASPGELRAAGNDYPDWVVNGYLGLPPELPSRIGLLSQKITRGKRNPYDRVQAVQDYLLQIRYSQDVDAPPEGADGVDHFLFEQRAGYCQHFASAMVVLLRSIGIPSRLVAGYLGGDPENGKYIVRERHYHAWAEVYFPDYGWVEFDPTPAGDPVAEEPETSPETVPATPEPEKAEDTPDQFVAGSGGDPWGGLPSAESIWVGLIAAAGLAALGGITAILWRRRVRESRPELSGATQVYARMCGMASRLGFSPPPQSTPSEYAARLASALPSHANLIDQVAQAYNRERYGPRKALSSREGEDLERAWHGLRGAFWRHLPGFAINRLFRRR